MTRLAALCCLAGALSACAAPCTTADLEARYAADLVTWCTGADGRPMPLAECPAHPHIAADFERELAKRLEGTCPPPR